MSDLGYLLWWRVGDIGRMDHATLVKALGEGMLPKPPTPTEVFRRLASGSTMDFELDQDRRLTLSIAPVTAPSKRLINHHLVGTVRQGMVVKVQRKVGEMVFYKPRDGVYSQARMRLIASSPDEWRDEVQTFVDWLRREYDHGVKGGGLNSQALRRAVRARLAATNAVYLDGPYFIEDQAQISNLRGLFDALGDDSFIHDTPYPDTPQNRAFLARGVERAVRGGTDIPESIWDLLETTDRGERT